MRHDREFWAKAVGEIERGASVERVARRLGVRPKTLKWWCWKLGGERAAPKNRTRLVPVVVEAVPTASNGEAIEIAVGNVRFRIAQGTDVRYIASLIDAVRAC